MQVSPAHALSLPLDRLPIGHVARIASIDWSRLDPAEARRLREFGLFEGVEVEVLHRGSLLFRDPLAIRVGRMRVAIRSVHAAAVMLDPVSDHVAEPAGVGTPVGLAGA